MATAEAQSFPHRIGASVLSVAEQLGGIAILATQILSRLSPRSLDRHELFRNLNKMGVRSVPMIAATAGFVGAIMVIQAAPLVEQFNATGFIGWGATFTTVRELGPLLIGLMFNGRVGANNTAELGTMVVTDQVDALRALAIDPISYLIVPRVISIISMMTLLTVIGDLIAILGAMGTGYALLGVHPRVFIQSAVEMLTVWDFAVGLIKAALFGVMMAMSSCYFGLATRGGAPGVGRAVNASVVASAAGIFIVDYLSTFILE